jgi:hypothetical protein
MAEEEEVRSAGIIVAGVEFRGEATEGEALELR